MSNRAFPRTLALALAVWIAGAGTGFPLLDGLSTRANGQTPGQPVPSPGGPAYPPPSSQVPGQYAPPAGVPVVPQGPETPQEPPSQGGFPPNTVPGQPGNTSSADAAQNGRPERIVPTNPLILPDPESSAGNTTVYYNGNGHQKLDDTLADEEDYTRQSQARARARKPLPLFGYSFFESARRVIEARRMYLERRYGPLAPAGDRMSGLPYGDSNLFRARGPGGPGSGPDGNWPVGMEFPPRRSQGNGGSDVGRKERQASSEELGAAAIAAHQANRSLVPGNGRDGQSMGPYGNGPSDSGQYNTPDGPSTSAPYRNRTQDYGQAGSFEGPADMEPYGSNQESMEGQFDSGQYDSGQTDTSQFGSGLYGDSQDGNVQYDPTQANSSQYGSGQGEVNQIGDGLGGMPPGQSGTFPGGDGTGLPGVAGAAAFSGNGLSPFYPPPQSANTGQITGGRYPSQQYPGFPNGGQFSPNGGQASAPFFNGGAPTQVGQDGGLGPVDAYHEVADPLSELYRNVTATVPADYQISAGDVLTVRYWSPTMEPREVTVKVDTQDAITLPGVGLGRLVVRGLTTAQAEHVLRSRLRRLYNGADVTITLREPRTIPVTVSGEAFAPGTYNVPAVSSAFNVLYAAGGPTRDGSLRIIEVRRAGRLVGTLDVYKLLLGSGGFSDIPLQPGDLISVLPRQSRVVVRGEVRQPAVYELADHETLRDALHFARGVKPSGVKQHVEINTLRPGTARVLKDVNLTDAAQVKALTLYDGDVVDVFSVRTTLTNRVTIAGAVDQPGDYALTSGMHVSDLLERARGPLPDAYTVRADLFRWNPNNTTTLVPVNLDQALAHDATADLPLTRWDRLQVYTRRQVAWTGQRQVTVRGAVQRPGVYTRSDRMHARDLLLQAGGPTPEASLMRVVLLHQFPNGAFDYHYVDLSPDATDDPLLQDDDVLAVYTTRQAQFTADHIVTILGEVVAPGPYPRGDGMHLSDLLKLAGGFRPGAATHVSVAHAYKAVNDPAARPELISATFDAQHDSVPGEDVLLQDGDVVTVQGTGGFQDKVSVVMVKGAVNRPGPVIMTDKMRLSDAIRDAGGMRDVAYAPGAEFMREPEMLASNEQRSLSQVISRLNDLLNQSAYKRELAKSDIERIKATQNATQSNTAILPLGNTSNTAAPNPAAAALAAQLSQHDLVSTPRSLGPGDLQPSGDLAVNLVSALRRPGGPEDIPLMDGDTITVPERPTTVQVVGAVFNARGVMYKPGAPLEYYINQAGGFAPDAASDRIEVIHSGGGLIPANKARALEPGDLILVPTKVLAEKIDRSGNAFSDFFTGLAGTAIVLKVAGSLFGL